MVKTTSPCKRSLATLSSREGISPGSHHDDGLFPGGDEKLFNMNHKSWDDVVIGPETLFRAWNVIGGSNHWNSIRCLCHSKRAFRPGTIFHLLYHSRWMSSEVNLAAKYLLVGMCIL